MFHEKTLLSLGSKSQPVIAPMKDVTEMSMRKSQHLEEGNCTVIIHGLLSSQ